MAETTAPDTDPVLPESLVFFVKTNKATHHGGFTFFSKDEFDGAKSLLENEADHIVKSAQESDPKVVLESWGVTSSLTGKVVEEVRSPRRRQKEDR